MPDILIICYGNPGRLDDGIAASFAAALQQEQLPGVAIDVDYQLSVEHAAAMAHYPTVLFVDAAVAGAEPFFLKRLTPQPSLSFSSHSVEPTALLALAADLFDSEVRGFALGIRGYEFNAFGERLSNRARHNIQMALKAIAPALRCNALDALISRLKIAHCTQAQPLDQRATAAKGDQLCPMQSA